MPVLTVTRRAILLSASLLLAGAVVAVVAAAACGDSERSRSGVNDEVVVSDGAELDDLPVSEAEAGDEIVVAGNGWTASRTVGFYLLAPEQSHVPFDTRGAIRLGEATPDEDGTVSFRFRLASSYETPSGEEVRIESGQEWRVWAFQRTDGGSSGTGVGPLTIK